LDSGQIAAIVAACDRLRDRFLFTLLSESGLRVGEALGLRHSDIDAAARLVSVVPRRNANGARAKGVGARRVPVPAGVIRLYAEYLHTEYGDLDSDYVFVNLWSGPIGHPMTYPSVYDLVCRIRERTAITFGPHVFRHSYATELLRRGVAVEVVAHLLGHASIATTGDAYAHLKVEDARRALVAAGWLADQDGPR
jgi:integrase